MKILNILLKLLKNILKMMKKNYYKYLMQFINMKRKLLGLLLIIAAIAGVVYLVNNSGGRERENSHILPSDTTTVATSKPIVRIYMENSGSMNGYVTTNSQFKNALGHLITKAYGFYPGTQLNFINQDILMGSIGNSASLNRYSYV